MANNIDRTIEYLKEKTGRNAKRAYISKPNIISLCSQITPDTDTPDEILLAIIGNCMMGHATTREWLAFKFLTKKHNSDIDFEVEMERLISSHLNMGVESAAKEG